MAVSAKINGTTYEMDKTYSITQQGGSVATTQIEVLLGANPVPSMFHTVQIYVGATLFFTGIITSLSTPEYSRGTESKVFSVQASSLEVLLSMRIMTASYYAVTYPTWADVVSKIFTDYIDDEGITLGGISTFSTGPDSKYVVTNKKVSDVLTEITQAIGNAVWWISPDRKFYFQVATDFTTVTTPSLLTKLKLTESIGDMRSVQTIRGATASVEATATNSTLQSVIAARTGGSGRVENYETDSDIHSDTAAGTVASNRLVQYVETEKEITCECHDLTNSGIYLDWNLSLSISGITISGHFVVVERTLRHFVNDTFTISVKLKNRNFFVRYGYSIKQTTVLASDVQTTYTDLASDERYTPSEKNFDKIKWASVLTERAQILADFTTYAITYTDYATKFQALADWLNDDAWSAGDPLFLSAGRITQTEIIVGATYLARWAEYYEKRDASNRLIIAARDASAVATSGVNVATLAPKYRGWYGSGGAAISTTLPTDLNSGDWIFVTNNSGGSQNGLSNLTSIVAVDVSGTLVSDSDRSHQQAAGADIVAWCALSSTYSPPEGWNFIENLAVLNLFVTNLMAQYLKIQTGGSLRGGNRFNADGTVADIGAEGFHFGADGRLKLYGIDFQGESTGNLHLVGGGEVIANNIGAANIMFADIFQLSTQSTWKGTQISAYAGGMARVQCASPLSLNEYGGDGYPCFMLFVKSTENALTAAFMITTADATPIDSINPNNTGCTFSYNATTKSLSWTPATDVLRFMVLCI